MFIETLKSIIIEGQELLEEINAVPRSFKFEEWARYVFVGVRQAGKSYLLYLRAKQLIAQGHSKEELLFINFDDERLIEFKASDFDSILKAYNSLYDHKPILFLDEIQNIDGWEHFARRLANQKYLTYITGSNAKMLSKEIATTLGARYIEKYVFPYSFKEYLLSKNIKVDKNWQYGKVRGEIERYVDQYLMWGGFPETNLFINKRQWLNELYEKIILGDIIQRNSIKNETALRLTVKRLAENVKTPTSYNRLAGMIKATGYKTSVASIAEYIRFCSESCLLIPIENYASKFAERTTIRKHYFIDNGLLTIFLTDSETSLMENLCAISLFRKSKQTSDYDVYYYNKEIEVDFYLPKLKKGIQSCYSLRDPSTFEREVNALVTFHKLYGLKEAEIVTFSEEMTIIRDGLEIHVEPLSKWLLDLEENDASI